MASPITPARSDRRGKRERRFVVAMGFKHMVASLEALASGGGA
jgi:hypothetical protein